MTDFLGKNEGKVARAGMLLVLVFLAGLFSGFLNTYSVLAFVFVLAAYLLLRHQLWTFLVISLPALAFGSVVYFPLTLNWTYEASLSEVLVLVAGIIYLAESFVEGKWERLRLDLVESLLLAWLLLSLASFGHIENARLFIFGLKVPAYSLLGYFLCRRLLDSRKKIDAFLVGVALLVLILSLQLLWKFYAMGFSISFMLDRSHVTVALGAIATVAAILVLMLPVMLGKFYASEKNKNNIFLPAVLLGSAAVVLTLGKAAIASLVLGYLFFYWRHQEKKNDFFLFGALFLVSGMLIASSFLEGLFTRLMNAFSDVNSRYRVFELRMAWRVAKDHLLFGVGSGQQLSIFQRLMSVESPQLINNFFVQFLVDLGVAGLALGAGIVARFAMLAKRMLAHKKNHYLISGFVAAFIAAFINGLAEVTFFALPFALVFWPLAGVFSSLNEKYE